MSESENQQEALEAVAKQLAEAMQKIEMQDAMIKSCIETNRQLHSQLAALPAMQAYVREVSLFHRQVLLPVLDVLKQAAQQATEANAVSASQLNAFVAKLEAKTKFYDANQLVVQAHQRAEDEQRKLEESKRESKTSAVNTP